MFTNVDALFGLNISKVNIYNMFAADEAGSAEGRTAMTNATVRSALNLPVNNNSPIKALGKKYFLKNNNHT